MTGKPPEDTQRIIDCLSRHRETLVGKLVRHYQRSHPHLDGRARAACADDARYHVEHLLGALTTGETRPFEIYAAWLANVLESRDIPRKHLMDTFEHMGQLIGQRLTDLDVSPAHAVLQAGIRAAQRPEPVLQSLVPSVPDALQQVQDYTATLLRGDSQGATGTALALMDQGMDLIDIQVRLLQPALYRIGRLWQENRISVAQEHLATAVAQNVMARAFAHAHFDAPSGRKALFACVRGNFHSLGLRMVADAFEIRGWEVQFLGANTPTEALLSQIRDWRPELVGLSISVLQQYPTLHEVLDRLHAELGADCPRIMVGGLATNVVDGRGVYGPSALWAPSAREAPDVLG